MARSFNGSSDFANSSSSLSLSSFNQLSISLWLKWTTFTNNDDLAMESSTNANTNTGAFFVNPNSSTIANDFTWRFNNGGNINVGFAQPSAGVWHHYLLLIDGTQTGNAVFPAAYVDGVSQSRTFVGSGGVATSFSNQTLYIMSRAGTSLFGTGSLADLALFGGVLLNSAEAAALGNGARPNSIRTGPTYWWPFDGLQSPEPDLSGKANNATLTGSAIAGGPPFMQLTPRMPTIIKPVSIAGPSFQPAWAMRNRIVVEGIGI